MNVRVFLIKIEFKTYWNKLIQFPTIKKCISLSIYIFERNRWYIVLKKNNWFAVNLGYKYSDRICAVVQYKPRFGLFFNILAINFLSNILFSFILQISNIELFFLALMWKVYEVWSLKWLLVNNKSMLSLPSCIKEHNHCFVGSLVFGCTISLWKDIYAKSFQHDAPPR